jgi:WD40 repeat protein
MKPSTRNRINFSLPGHTEAIICSQFSPDCLQLATGGGDACVRLWDMNTETPRVVCKGHKNWVRFPSHANNTAFAFSSQLSPPLSPPFNKSHSASVPPQVLSVAWSPDGSTVASGR